MSFLLSIISLVVVTVLYFLLIFFLEGPLLAYYAPWIGWLFAPLAIFLLLEIKKEKSFIRHHVSSKLLHRLDDKKLVNYLIYSWVAVLITGTVLIILL